MSIRKQDIPHYVTRIERAFQCHFGHMQLERYLEIGKLDTSLTSFAGYNAMGAILRMFISIFPQHIRLAIVLAAPG